MEIAWIMGGVFFLMTVVYIALVVFAPEVVGIQGKAAREIEASHEIKKEPTTSAPSDQI